MLSGFYFTLIKYGVPISLSYVLHFHDGMKKGLVNDIDELFLFARLCFVKRVEHNDPFERAFSEYFTGVVLLRVLEGNPDLLETREFKEWLSAEIQAGLLPYHKLHGISAEELMKRFWDTVHLQNEAHNGGSRFIGTGGNSPFGHSGNATRGIRAMGQSSNRSAFKVFGDRRYVDYASTNTLCGENLRQALGHLKNMVPKGAFDTLDIDQTIARSAKNGGEIDLVLRRDLRNELKVILLVDNGGTSMLPYVRLTRLLFAKMVDQLRECTPYYFHNAIYNTIYSDPARTEAVSIRALLEKDRKTRIVIIGDACMAPEELFAPGGSIEWGVHDDEPAMLWLERLRDRFPHLVWLNPIAQGDWSSSHGFYTISRIAAIVPMEDLTIEGIKRAVAALNRVRD